MAIKNLTGAPVGFFDRSWASLLACVGAFWIAWGAVGSVEAGYSRPKKNIVGVSVGGETATKAGLKTARKNNQSYPPIEAPLTAAETMELALHEPFKSLTPAQRLQRLAQIRECMLCIFDTIEKESPGLAKCLRQLYAQRMICMEFSSQSRSSSLKADGLTSCGKERMNIHIRLIPSDPAAAGKSYTLPGVLLLNALAHEGNMALADTLEDDATKTKKEKKIARENAHLNAFGKDVKRLEEYVMVLESIRNTGTVPPAIKGVAAEWGNELIADNPSQIGRSARAAQVLKDVKKHLARLKKLVEKRKARKRSVQKDKEGGNETGFNFQDLRGTGWHASAGELPNGDGFSIAGGGGTYVGSPPADVFVPNPTIGVTRHTEGNPDGTTVTFSSPGAISIADFYHNEVENILYYTYSTTTGGVLAGLEDSNGDGLVDQSHIYMSIPGPCLFAGIPGGTPDELFLADPRNGTIHHVFDGLPGGIPGRPDTLTTVGSAGPPVVELRDVFVTEDKLEVIGGDDDERLFTSDDEWSVGVRASVAFDFIPGARIENLGGFDFCPTIGEAPVHGAHFLELTGRPCIEVEVFLDNPSGPDTSLGSGFTGAGGRLNMHLAQPLPALPANCAAYVVDMETGKQSTDFFIVNEPSFVAIPPVQTSGDGHREVGLTGPPNLQVQLNQINGAVQPVGDSLRIDGYGNGFSSVESTATKNYFRFARIADSTQVPVDDILTATTGLNNHFQLSENDIFAPGDDFQIVGTSPSFVGLFKFTCDGNLVLNPKWNAGTIKFDYCIVRKGLMSPPATVCIEVPPVPPELYDLPGVFVPDAFGGFIEFVNAPVLCYNGKVYPLYQFVVGNGPLDSCFPPHWHTFRPAVYSISESIVDLTGIPDPDPPGCGFGWVILNPPKRLHFFRTTWDAFLFAHPP